MDAREVRASAATFFALVEQLGKNRQGTTADWLQLILSEIDTALLQAFDRERILTGARVRPLR